MGDQPPCRRCGSTNRDLDWLRQESRYDESGRYVRTGYIRYGRCHQCGAPAYKRDLKVSEGIKTVNEESKYLVGCFHNGITRSSFGATSIAPKYDKVGAPPIPLDRVEAAQDFARSANHGNELPKGSGWVHAIVEADCKVTAIAAATGLPMFSGLVQDHGSVELIVHSDFDTWARMDDCAAVTVTAEEYAELLSGMKLKEMFIKEAAIEEMEHRLPKEIKQDLRDIVEGVFGDADPSEQGAAAFADYIKGLDRDEIVSWVDSVFSTIASCLERA